MNKQKEHKYLVIYLKKEYIWVLDDENKSQKVIADVEYVREEIESDYGTIEEFLTKEYLFNEPVNTWKLF